MLRLSEVYQSVQGEGPRVGSPTVFVRFAGCNLRCPGWPCDTPFAIDPALFRQEWRTVSHVDIADEILDVCGDNIRNICFTGGEPMLQSEKELELLVNVLIDRGFKTFEAFSNGTIIYPDWWLDNIYTVMDWKLPGSGEKTDVTERWKNSAELGAGDAVKFTIKDREDYDIACQVWSDLEEMWQDDPSPTRPVVYYGPVWDAIQPKTLVEWVLSDGFDWKLNLQIHNMIWDRTERGI
jgi:7-carboxy-7-deazaguanine synthase